MIRVIDSDLDRRRLHLGVCALCAFCSLIPQFTETRPNIRTAPALPYSQYSATSQSSDAPKPSSTTSGGLNMKIKQQLPSLIRSNNRQAGVTKAEQEKPLTANHCIDRQAPPPAQTSPHLCPAHTLTCIVPSFICLYFAARTCAGTQSTIL